MIRLREASSIEKSVFPQVLAKVSPDEKAAKFYITTAIPYVNASPHIGHALEFVQTYVIARAQRLLGRDVYVTTGADENSLKNVQAADAKGVSTQQLCDENAQLFKDFATRIGLGFNAFIRSSSKDVHWPGVYKLWNLCDKAGDIYKKQYKGLYCVGCEAFYKENELVDGLCPEHLRRPDVVEEENYFFRLSKYEKQLLKLIESNEFRIVPNGKREEVLSFIRSGLEDFSISRSIARAHGWGVPVPGDDSQIMYVWFDALSCYLTGVGWGIDEAKFWKWWPADIHVIGKDITRFHTVYWPAMLLSARLPLPREILIHGFVTAEGQKMSKSLGNVVYPAAVTDKYGVDIFRYYLASEVSSFEDGDYSESRLIEKTNNELIANFGNFVYRVLSFLKSSFSSTVPEAGGLLPSDEALLGKVKTAGDEFAKNINGRNSQRAFQAVLNLASEGNRYFQSEKPWETRKTDPLRCATTLNVSTNVARALAVLVSPFLPFASERLWSQLGLAGDVHAQSIQCLDALIVKPGQKVGSVEPLFTKIEVKRQ